MQTLSQFLVGKFVIEDNDVLEISEVVMSDDGRTAYVVVPQRDGGLDLKSLQSVIGYNYVYPSALLARAAADEIKVEYERGDSEAA